MCSKRPLPHPGRLLRDRFGRRNHLMLCSAGLCLCLCLCFVVVSVLLGLRLVLELEDIPLLFHRGGVTGGILSTRGRTVTRGQHAQEVNIDGGEEKVPGEQMDVGEKDDVEEGVRGPSRSIDKTWTRGGETSDLV